MTEAADNCWTYFGLLEPSPDQPSIDDEHVTDTISVSSSYSPADTPPTTPPTPNLVQPTRTSPPPSPLTPDPAHPARLLARPPGGAASRSDKPNTDGGATYGGAFVGLWANEIGLNDGPIKMLHRATFEEFSNRQPMGAASTSTTSTAAPTTPRGASQDDTASGVVSSEEPMAGSSSITSERHVHWAGSLREQGRQPVFMVAGPSSRPKSRRSDPCCMPYGLRDPDSRARSCRSYMPA
jgi:hypothetical protein